MTEPLIDAIAPLRFARLPEAQTRNAALSAAFEREKNRDDVRRTHSFGGRFENTYIDLGRLPELLPIRAFVLAAAGQILQREQAALKLGFWFNEMQPGQRTTLHSHEELDELLSAVYYVNCPADSGRLLLHDHDAMISVRPSPGMLLLFPPDLPHEVEENRSAQTRLSVAFNVGPAEPGI